MTAHLRRDQWLALLVALGAGGLPLLLALPPAALALFYGGILVRARWPLAHPGRAAGWLLTMAAPVAAVAVWMAFRTLNGREPGATLLIVLIALKLFECRSVRDGRVLAALAIGLVAVGFLFAQGFFEALFGAATAAIVLAAALRLQLPAGVAPGVWGRETGWLAASAIPLTLVLFFLFPRLPGPLWGVPETGSRALTGLSDTMAPGNISSIARSEALAFRAEFAGDVPPYRERYWRGPVLWDTDGRTWSAGPPVGVNRPAVLDLERGDWDQAITLEPHEKRWMFALDRPVRGPRDAEITPDGLMVARQNVTVRRLYRVRSGRPAVEGELAARELVRGLALPPALPDSVRQLALGWRNEGKGDPEAVVRRALEHFRSEPFFYTWTPPLAVGDATEDFLFRSRRGFCEHYAAAFTVLMRAAGIPARVVTGYLGGEWNPVGGYLIVRQSDAHAWAEVWVRNRGWVRVDPTAAVAPERIERAPELPDFAGLGDAPVRFTVRAEALWDWRETWRRWYDATENTWNMWVLGYGPELQRELYRAMPFSLNALWQMGAWTFGLALLVIALHFAWGLVRGLRPRPGGRGQRWYRRFCAYWARAGMARRHGEGAQAYGERVAARHPACAVAVRAFARHYQRWRYGGADADEARLAECYRLMITCRRKSG